MIGLYRDELGLVTPGECSMPLAPRADLRAVRRVAHRWITRRIARLSRLKVQFSSVSRLFAWMPSVYAALRALMVSQAATLPVRSRLTTWLRRVVMRSVSRRANVNCLGSRPRRTLQISEKFPEIPTLNPPLDLPNG